MEVTFPQALEQVHGLVGVKVVLLELNVLAVYKINGQLFHFASLILSAIV